MSSNRPGLSSKAFVIALLAWLFIVATVLPSSAQTVERPSGWTDKSHGNRVPANYDVVLPDDRINEIYISFTPQAWAAEEADMIEMYGERGAGGQQDRGPALQFASRNRIWVPVTVRFREQTWREVGFRYKGNSTLQLGWRNGRIELPFKLDFDEFEDEHPELDNQRFFGFKQLSFSNNDFDPSLQREKVTADIFRNAGLPAAETAYYAVYGDNGASDGFHYWGIYTAVELPDDTLIETQFADDNGNMYKPQGPGATFAAGSFSEENFDKETNGDSGFDDVLAVFDALHAETRLSDPAAWRGDLEAVFDVAGFLRWLAANTLIQNWDTYGVMSHNYYLYADDTTGQLVWIPWDNNMALSSTMGGRGRDRAQNPARRGEAEPPAIPTPGGRSVLNLTMDDLDVERWPLIGYLLEQKQYHQFYIDEVERISSEVFTPERMIPIYETNFALLGEKASESGDENARAILRAATDELIAHVSSRAEAANAVLQAQTAN